MFGMNTRAAESTARRRIEVAAVNGTLAAAIVGNRLRLIRSLGPGFPATTSSITAPPGKVVALDPAALTAVTADGALWAWRGEDWLRVGTVMEDRT